MKKLPGIFAVVVIVGMMAMVAMQSDKIEDLRYEKELMAEDLTIANDELELKGIQLEEAHLKIEELEAEIKRLNGIISSLDKEISEYKESLKNLRGRISKLKKKVTQLSSQITDLQQEQNANWQKISDLIKEKETAEAEIEGLKLKEESIEEVKEEAEVEQVIREQKTNELNELRSMLTSTMVNFQKVNALKKVGGKPLNKIKSNSKNWKYTHIKFSLDNPNQELLKKYQYVVKILDLETGMTLPHNENNPEFPAGESNTDGFILDYDGNLADILYFNNTKKQSQNYEVRVYVRLNGNDLPLTKGKCPIVEHGKAIPIQ